MYEIVDGFGDLFGQYVEQEGLFRTIYYMHRARIDGDKYSIMHVNDDQESEDFEAETYLGVVADWGVWFGDVEQLRFHLMLYGGTDMIGLHEFIQCAGYAIDWEYCECPPTALCGTRYTALIPDDLTGYTGTGYMRGEALAKAWLELIEDKRWKTQKQK
jgi:hypothetical protein